jgi:ubiquinone/menaquinone biosynthesis C-methylase UbiE
MAKEILRIEKVEGDILSLSFIAKEKDHIRQRSERYFRNIKFSKDQWVTAVAIALDEYFKVLKELLKRHPDGEGISPMIKYVELWDKINN